MNREKLMYGAAYYPELWDEGTVNKDIERMKRLGLDVVRMGEFAWSVLEPEEGRIDISVFVNVIQKLHENGISTVMCTPTPTPPIWVSHGHPERMHDDGGPPITHGARQHVCTNNAYFREKSALIVQAVAEACGQLPGVIAWQTDNEFKCNVAECYCQSCEALWHEWLEQRYGTVEQLNEAWGADVWSTSYQDFSQVPAPRRSSFLHSPSLMTMYKLFSRDKIAEYQQMQVDILRKYSKAPITHNSALYFKLDNEKMFENLDFASLDDYPHADDYPNFAFGFERFRCLKPENPFWVMETTPFHNSVHVYPMGFVRAASSMAFVMGAGGFSHWHFHQHRSGCELPHGGLLSAWGQPTVGYEQVRLAIEAKNRMERVLKGSVLKKPTVAIHYSDKSKAFMEDGYIGRMDYIKLLRELYDPMLAMGLERDVIPEKAPVDGYQTVFTPYVYHLSDGLRDEMLEFARQGGTWVVGPLTGIRTEHHTIHTDKALGEVLETALGIEIFNDFPAEGASTKGIVLEQECVLHRWSYFARPAGAKPLGAVTEGINPGECFMTEIPYGRGKLVFLGSMPAEKEAIEAIIRYLAPQMPVVTAEQGVVTVTRQKNGKDFFVCVNMTGQEKKASAFDRDFTVPVYDFITIE